MFFSPNFKTVHVHMDRPEQLAVNHRWKHLLGWSVQRTDDNKTCKSWSALITKDKTTDGEGMHFLLRNLAGTSSLVDNPVDVPRRSALGGHDLLFDVGGGRKQNGNQPLLCKMASAGGRWKLTDRHCLDCPMHTWRASKVDPETFLQKQAVLAGTNSNLHESVFEEHPGTTQRRWQSMVALFSFHKGPPNFRRRPL